MSVVIVSKWPFSRESYNRLRRFMDKIATAEREDPAAFNYDRLNLAIRLASGSLTIDDYAHTLDLCLHDEWLPEASK